MQVTVGTFNVNNLFSRFNFQGEIDQLQHSLTATYTFGDPTRFRIRTYQGRLVKGKPGKERAKVGQRMLDAPVDVWALQEVEDIDTLRFFAANELAGRYPHQILIEGNDPRLIDIAVISRLPLGAATSWQHATHPEQPEERVFSRDLLEVEIYDPQRRRRLLTLFNNHLKSHYVPPDQDQHAGQEAANQRRRRQAETAARIVAAHTRPDSPYLVCGDMNDPPDSPWLAPLVAAPELQLVNGLAEPTETRPAPQDNPPPASPAWTHRFKPAHQPADYELFDQLWLSPALADHLQQATIGRRDHLTGDGSDHDPGWITLDL